MTGRTRNEWSPSKVGGLYGQGMHNFILRELEIGYRAAAAEDEEWFTGLGVCGWTSATRITCARKGNCNG